MKLDKFILAKELNNEFHEIATNTCGSTHLIIN